MKLFFMAHPVGPYIAHDANTQTQKEITVQTNLNRAIFWQSICLSEGFPTIIPYYELCHALDDSKPEDRKFGMAIDREVISRCDGFILCGEKVSNGMAEEFAYAKECDKPFIRLIQYTPDEARFTLKQHISWL